MEFLFRNEFASPSPKVSCSSLGPREPWALLWAVPRLGGLAVAPAGVTWEAGKCASHLWMCSAYQPGVRQRFCSARISGGARGLPVITS